MKNLLPLLLSLISQPSTAQSFLVPFAKNDLYGLMNEKGKVVTKAEYNDVKWLTGQYFKTSIKRQLDDTIETTPNKFYIQNSEITLTGLMYGNKVILKNEPFYHYEILPGKCILARSEGTKHTFTREQFKKYGQIPKFVSLFNLNGENVFPKNFRSLQMVDSTGFHPSLKGHSRFILFAAELANGNKGLIIYDVVNQNISEWLVEGLGNTKLVHADRDKHSFAFTETDGSGSTTRYHVFSDGEKFLIEKKNDQQPIGRESEPDSRFETVTMEGDNHVAVPDFNKESPTPDSVLRKRFRPFYTLVNDSLFYVVFTNEKIFIPLPKTHSPIFLRPHSKPIQNMPVITKAKSKYFLADSAGLQKTAYDSMMYFGSDFLVWKKINGKLQCGTIDKKGKNIIPVLYDSIHAGMKVLSTQSSNIKDSTYLVFKPYRQQGSRGFENGSHTISISQTLVAFKNGTAILLSPQNEPLLPLHFNMIAENSIDFFKPAQSNFIVVERNGKFGVAKRDRNEMKIEVPVSLPFAPLFCYENYFGIPGLTVYGLYSMDFKLKGFGTSDGKMIGF